MKLGVMMTTYFQQDMLRLLLAVRTANGLQILLRVKVYKIILGMQWDEIPEINKQTSYLSFTVKYV